MICKQNGDELIMTETLPMFLTETYGITDMTNEVVTQPTNGKSGEIYAGSTAVRRNIVIVLQMHRDIHTVSERLLSFFVPDAVGRLYYYVDNSPGKVIDYYVESVSMEEQGFTRRATVSLICPDPLFRVETDTVQSMANWDKRLKFPFTYGEPVIVARRNASKMATFTNTSNVKAGFVAKIYAMGDVASPSLTMVETGEKLKVNAQMHNGDILEISTADGGKYIRLNGVNVNNLWEFGSTWLQLPYGQSSITYDAESGAEYMSVTVTYSEKYYGA